MHDYVKEYDMSIVQDKKKYFPNKDVKVISETFDAVCLHYKHRIKIFNNLEIKVFVKMHFEIKSIVNLTLVSTIILEYCV